MTQVIYFIKIYVKINLIVFISYYKHLYFFIEIWSKFKKFDLVQNQNNFFLGRREYWLTNQKFINFFLKYMIHKYKTFIIIRCFRI